MDRLPLLNAIISKWNLKFEPFTIVCNRNIVDAFIDVKSSKGRFLYNFNEPLHARE